MESERLLVVDITALPESYKDLNEDDIRNKLESEYGSKVLLIDTSRQNMAGNTVKNHVYFI